MVCGVRSEAEIAEIAWLIDVFVSLSLGARNMIVNGLLSEICS
jgi:hypothetical protein